MQYIFIQDIPIPAISQREQPNMPHAAAFLPLLFLSSLIPGSSTLPLALYTGPINTVTYWEEVTISSCFEAVTGCPTGISSSTVGLATALSSPISTTTPTAALTTPSTQNATNTTSLRALTTSSIRPITTTSSLPLTNSSSTTLASASATAVSGSGLPITVKYQGQGVNLYLTGKDANGRLVLLQPNGQWYYPPTDISSSVPTVISADKITIPVSGSGPSTTITMPRYLEAGRIWLAQGSLQFSVVMTSAGPSLVEPSINGPAGNITDWGFVELTYTAEGLIWVDSTYVDFVGMNLAITLQGADIGTETVPGLEENAVETLCQNLTSQASKDGYPWDELCVAAPNGKPGHVLAPADYINNKNSNAFAGYYDSYVDQVWSTYSSQPLIIDSQAAHLGNISCTVSNSNLICKDEKGSSATFAKPSAADIFSCASGPFALGSSATGVQKAVVPRLCAAFHRSTLLLNGGNNQPNGVAPKYYYSTETTNWYSKLVHELEKDGRGYAFPYDDVARDSSNGDENQSGVIVSNSPTALIITISPKLTWSEKLDLVPAFLSIALAAFYAGIKWPLHPSSGADTYYHHIIHALVRQVTRRLSIAQAQWVSPSFIKVYEKWCSKNQYPTTIVSISQFTEGLWLGNSSADYVMIYFHGGGFAFGGNDGHLLLWDTIIAQLQAAGISLGVLFVVYPLMPYSVFPCQFQEAINSIRYVITDLGRRPGQIILGGDSAGGNLVATALLHAKLPSTLASPLPEVLSLEKFKSAILISPWVNFNTALPSFKSNRNKDYLEAETEKRWSDMYVNTQPASPYNEPALASPIQWSGLPVKDVLVTAGSNEVLLDGIEEWVKTLQVSFHNTNITYKLADNEPHEAPLIWPIFGDHRETQTHLNILEWLTRHLKDSETA
ncbi:hypothetical protein PV08_11703 [Exophiala spinifera]|uniref:GH64 domain-containing protein n=1 Tax=Exophiala spinifera TaxID=91928 RepID=A0A0D1ZA82_9EURO|nr:uncharacterized protein PV08_11703 [Exophiala spinifera]KIW09927.1 hypothetical protein PV08_11703 [Exophiala spinifera]